MNGELLPHLKGLEKKPNATPKQKVISEIISGVERVRIDTEKNFCDVLDKVHELHADSIDSTHVFAISQVYEGLLLKMGEIIRAMVRATDPQIGETIYDPCCGTGGFLVQAYEFTAGATAAPFKKQAQAKWQEANQWKERLAELKKTDEDKRTLAEIIAAIEAHGAEVAAALAQLKKQSPAA